MTVMIVSTCALASAMISIYLSLQSPAVRIPKPIRFIAFNVLAKLFFLRKEVPEEPNVVGAGEKRMEKNKVNIVDLDMPDSTQKKWVGNDLEGMRCDLMILKNIVVNREQDAFVMDEWKCLGKIVDRLLFWLCTVIFLITILSIMTYE